MPCIAFATAQNFGYWVASRLALSIVGASFVIRQIADTVGAYGNVGAVAYLTLFSLLPKGNGGTRIFFQVLGVASVELKANHSQASFDHLSFI